jgi:hypothetical protein
LLLHVHIEATLVCSHEVDNIDVGPIDILDGSLSSINSYRHGLVDANSFNSVTWLDEIDKVLIDAKMNSVRGLTFRYGFWGLLHLDVLLVGEVTTVVNKLERVALLAVLTVVGLKDAASCNELLFCCTTFETLEVSLFHFRDDVRVADDDTLD